MPPEVLLVDEAAGRGGGLHPLEKALRGVTLAFVAPAVPLALELLVPLAAKRDTIARASMETWSRLGEETVAVLADVVTLRQTAEVLARLGRDFRYLVSGARPVGALSGWAVLLTRPLDEHEETFLRLESAGAEVLRFPTVTIERLPSPDGPAGRRLEDYDWLVFTSRNAVSAFVAAYSLGGLSSLPVPVAVVGPRTAEEVRRHGGRVALMASEHRSEGLLAALRPKLQGGARILLPQALEGRDNLARGLAQVGAQVDVMPLYRTVPLRHPSAERVAEALARGEVDVSLFFSPSAVRAFVQQVPAPPATRCLAIGPETAAALRQAGFTNIRVAKVYTEDGLVEELLAWRKGR